MSADDMVRVTLPKPMLMARCENRAFLVAGFESPEECKAFIYAINTASLANDRAITDEQILALNAGEVFFSESPTRYPEAGHGTQYHAGAPGVIKFARALLAASMGGDKS